MNLIECSAKSHGESNFSKEFWKAQSVPLGSDDAF
jgi:hypothetical protein